MAFHLTLLSGIIFSEIICVVAYLVLHSFLLLNTTPFCGVTFCLSFHLTFHVLAIMNNAVWTFVDTFPCGHVLWILLSIYRGAELPGHMVTVCWSLKTKQNLPNCFLKYLHHFTFPWTMYENSSFFTFSPALSILFITAILVVVKWFLPHSWFLHMEHPPIPCSSSRVTNLSFKQYLLQKAFFFFFFDPPKPQVIVSFFKFFKTLLMSLVVCFFPYVAFFVYVFCHYATIS